MGVTSRPDGVAARAGDVQHDIPPRVSATSAHALLREQAGLWGDNASELVMPGDSACRPQLLLSLAATLSAQPPPTPPAQPRPTAPSRGTIRLRPCAERPEQVDAVDLGVRE